MPRKSTGPYLGPPTWLSPETERSLETSPRWTSKDVFVMDTLWCLKQEGLTPQQAFAVAANAVSETGWGEHCYWNNAGGWKITSTIARDYLKRTGSPAPWYKSRGNVDSGDPDWCFYQVFLSLRSFYAQWVLRFVPQTSQEDHRYHQTGEDFHSTDPERFSRWFGDLCQAGYKGTKSAEKMASIRSKGLPDTDHPSVKSHLEISQRVSVMFVQSILGLKPDGSFGPASKAMVRSYQSRSGLPDTGSMDATTVAKLWGSFNRR